MTRKENLTPYILYGDKLKSRGITLDMIENAKFIMYGAFGKDFFDKIKEKTENTMKNGIAKLFTTHLLYQYTTTPIPKDILWLIEISKILDSFKTSACIGEYLKRLKSDDNFYPALFELLFAKHLKDKGNIIDLQKTNILGNPVEIVFIDKSGNNYRVECKTSKKTHPKETFSQKIDRKLTKLIETFPNGVGINIILDDNINGDDFADDIIKEVSSILHEQKDFLSSSNVNVRLDFNFGRIEYIRFGDGTNHTSEEIQSYFHNNSVEHKLSSISNIQDLEKDMKSDPMEHKKSVKQIFGIKYNTKLIHKKEISGDSLENDIKKKISQQKNLLDTKDEVIICLDKQYYKQSEIDNLDARSFSKYNNLSIILAEYETDEIKGRIDKKYYFLLNSNGLDENIIL